MKPSSSKGSGDEIIFDERAADRAVTFFERYLRHAKGEWAGQPFALLDWQRDEVIRPLFGWKRADGTRRYRTAFISVPRKNGKSTIVAGIGLYLLFGDGEMGAEIYSAAADREQAAIVFELAKTMVSASQALSRRAETYSRTIVYPRTGSFYRVLSAVAPKKHGFNPHGVLFDELHAQRNRDLWDALTTGTGARQQPLVVAITTAGYDRESVCYEVYNYARKVRDGTVEDPSFLAVIHEAEEKARWQDPAVWRAANPSIGVTIKEPYLADEARKAAEMPAYQNTFRRLHLNQWVQQATRWIDMDLWDENAGEPIREEDLRGRTCYGGLDLSSTQDLTAWVLIFPELEDPEQLTVLPRFWTPTARLTDTKNIWRAQYQAWARDGFLRTTPGLAVDHEAVFAQIVEDMRTFTLVDLGYDRWLAAQTLAKLEAAGLGGRAAAVGTGYAGMTAPTKELERRLLARKMRHGGHPVLRWNADNVSVSQDPSGNLKPNKATSQGKIDGISALLIGMDRALRHGAGSVYERRGVIAL